MTWDLRWTPLDRSHGILSHLTSSHIACRENSNIVVWLEFGNHSWWPLWVHISQTIPIQLSQIKNRGIHLAIQSIKHIHSQPLMITSHHTTPMGRLKIKKKGKKRKSFFWKKNGKKEGRLKITTKEVHSIFKNSNLFQFTIQTCQEYQSVKTC